VGTIGVRPFSEIACEAKRLYVRPQYRGRSLGRALFNRAIQQVRLQGYTALYGDTLPNMVEARKLYANLGFQEVGPYSDHPTPGAVYLKLSLAVSRSA
jgi:putative acetyltransferase